MINNIIKNMDNEIICGYEVTNKRKKVWNVELDILNHIIEICKKNNINYSICGGSLLGAVRHHGFIPWDDDIDICMKREEYDRFINIATSELKFPYFVQYYKTEKLYTRGHAQIRNSNTTAILYNEYNQYNKGIFVDVFPLDNIPDNKIQRFFYINKLVVYKKILNIQKKEKDYFIKKIIKNILFINQEKRLFRFEKVVRKYNKYNTKQCGAISFLPKEFKYENDWFDNYIDLSFEKIEVKSIKKYDELLTKEYGNYMEIPSNKNGSIHGSVFFDTEKNYKYYNNIKL